MELMTKNAKGKKHKCSKTIISGTGTKGLIYYIHRHIYKTYIKQFVPKIET